MTIPELDLQIHSRSGWMNANIDAFSYYPLPATKSDSGGNIPERLIAVITTTEADEPGDLASAQFQDEELAPLITYLVTCSVG